MRRLFENEKIPIEVSAWTEGRKKTALIFAILTFLSASLTVFFQVTIPGLTPITMAIVMLLMSVRFLNIYIDDRRRKPLLFAGLLFTVIFCVDLYVGILQIVDAVSRGAV